MPVLELIIQKEIEATSNVVDRIGTAVSFFGSGRVQNNDKIYISTFLIAKELASSGYSVISGGGPGIMRAANEGAYPQEGKSVGFNISLPFEKPNLNYQDISITFESFFTRKFAFSVCSNAFVVMPGGTGTLDELFEILTLIQKQKLKKCPVILFGANFWKGLVSWMRDQPVEKGFIAREEVEDLIFVDHPKDVIQIIKSNVPLTSLRENIDLRENNHGFT